MVPLARISSLSLSPLSPFFPSRQQWKEKPHEASSTTSELLKPGTASQRLRNGYASHGLDAWLREFESLSLGSGPGQLREGRRPPKPWPSAKRSCQATAKLPSPISEEAEEAEVFCAWLQAGSSATRHVSAGALHRAGSCSQPSKQSDFAALLSVDSKSLQPSGLNLSHLRGAERTSLRCTSRSIFSSCFPRR